jgi:hypothetical protein
VPNSPEWIFHDLNALVNAPECHLTAGHAISDGGYITGTAVCDGLAVGFLLTPVVNTAAVE